MQWEVFFPCIFDLFVPHCGLIIDACDARVFGSTHADRATQDGHRSQGGCPIHEWLR